MPMDLSLRQRGDLIGVRFLEDQLPALRRPIMRREDMAASLASHPFEDRRIELWIIEWMRGGIHALVPNKRT